MTCANALAPGHGHTLSPTPAHTAPYCVPADGVAAQAWLRADSLRLAPNRPSITRARRHTATVVTAWGLAHIRNDVEVVAGELLSNALHATQRTGIAAPIGLRLLASASLLALETWDCSPYPPRLNPPGPPLAGGSDTAEPHGNGLLLVAEFSHDWGYIPRPDGGKVVFALFKP